MDFKKWFYCCSSLSNDDITSLSSQVWKQVWKNGIFLVWDRVMVWRTGRHTPTKNSHVYPPGCLRSVTLYPLSLWRHTNSVCRQHWIWVDSFAEYSYNCNVCMLEFFFFIFELKNIEKKIHLASATVRRVFYSGGGGTPYNGPHKVLIGSCLN